MVVGSALAIGGTAGGAPRAGGGRPPSWDVSDYCGSHIAGNANFLWLYEGFDHFESASRHGKTWLVGHNGDAELGTVRPRPHTNRRWDFLALNGRRVAWARGPDGGAAGLAWFGAGPGCIGN